MDFSLLAVLIVGLAVGLISTIFGLGGGVLMVPTLTMITPFSHVEAIGTSLTTVVLVTAWNTWRYHRRGLVIWKTVFGIITGSVICSALAAYIATFLPEKFLIAFMLLFLLFLAWKTFGIKEIKPGSKKAGALAAFGIGSLSGTVAGLVGIGGGGITTPLMLITGLAENRSAAPTSNAVMIFTAGAGALTYASRGIIGPTQLQYSLLLAFGAILSSFIGVRINQHLGIRPRRRMLGIILLLITLRLAWQLI
ncbi:MAG: sulfite exporter TauE/SafE family protein [Deltaproteobacteria bacterium]|nr:sulfite exporter TauE/SafE family protein [Deltaproteobacteria bacterium]